MTNENTPNVKYTHQDIPIKLIVDSPLHFDRHHSEEGLDELAESVRKIGIVNPITVRKKGKVYELLAGKRRLTTLRNLRLNIARCTIVACDDYHAELISIEENVKGTEPLSQAELKKAIDRIVELTKDQIGKREDFPDESRMTKRGRPAKDAAEKEGQDKAAEVLKVDKRTVKRMRNLDTLIAAARRAFDQGKLTLQQAELLAALPTRKQQEKLPILLRESQKQTDKRETYEQLKGKDSGALKAAKKLYDRLQVRCGEVTEMVREIRKELTLELVGAINEMGVDQLTETRSELKKLLHDTADVGSWQKKHDLG